MFMRLGHNAAAYLRWRGNLMGIIRLAGRHGREVPAATGTAEAAAGSQAFMIAGHFQDHDPENDT
jgi:hypothetical protein